MNLIRCIGMPQSRSIFTHTMAVPPVATNGSKMMICSTVGTSGSYGLEFNVSKRTQNMKRSCRKRQVLLPRESKFWRPSPLNSRTLVRHDCRRASKQRKHFSCHTRTACVYCDRETGMNTRDPNASRRECQRLKLRSATQQAHDEEHPAREQRRAHTTSSQATSLSSLDRFADTATLPKPFTTPTLPHTLGNNRFHAHSAHAPDHIANDSPCCSTQPAASLASRETDQCEALRCSLAAERAKLKSAGRSSQLQRVHAHVC